MSKSNDIAESSKQKQKQENLVRVRCPGCDSAIWARQMIHIAQKWGRQCEMLEPAGAALLQESPAAAAAAAA